MARTHTVKNSVKDGTPENQGSTFPVEDIKAVANSLRPKIAFRIAGCLLTEQEMLRNQQFNLFDDADAGERLPVSGEQSDYIPRMDRVQFWKGFADEHDLTIDFDGFKRFRQDQMQAEYKAACESKYNRDLEWHKKRAQQFMDDLRAAEVKFDEIAPRHDYTPEFLAQVYTAIHESIETTRKALHANPVKYPFNEMDDKELEGLEVLLDDLEKQI